MNRRGPIEVADEQCLAILLPRGRDRKSPWHVMVLRREGECFSVVAEREASAGDAALADWLAPHRPAVTLALLPASATVCRTCMLPPAQGEQLAAALRLQAETATLGSSSHRVGVAALPESTPGANRQGVILAWPESSTLPELPSLPPDTDLRFVPEVASLLELVEGQPPESAIIRADRAEGTIVFIVRGTDGVLLRSTREDGTDADGWREGVLRAAAETLLTAERGPEEIRSLQSAIHPHLNGESGGRTSFLQLPPSASRTVARHLPAGRTGDPNRDLDRALALGAALVASGPRAGLASIRRTLPKRKLHPLEVIAATWSEPRRAAGVIAAAAAIIVFAPLALSGVRYGILRMKLPNPEATERLNKATQNKAAVYKELHNEAWPMTKLLGDLANSLPEGIDVESLNIAHGDGVSLRGVAKPFDVKPIDGEGKPQRLTATEELTQLENLLRSTKIFTNAEYKWDSEDAKGYRGFTFTADVTSPTTVVAWSKESDFRERTQRDRKYPNWRTIEGVKSGDASKTVTAPPTTGEDHTAPGETGEEGTRTALADDEGSGPKPRAPTIPALPKKIDRGASRGNARDAEALPKPTEDGHDGVPAENGETAQPAPAEGEVPSNLPDRGINRQKPPVSEGKDPKTEGGRPQPQPATPEAEIPGPLTNDELKALSKTEAQALLGKIAKARQLPSLDADTTKRLKDDFNRVLLHAKSAS